MSYPTVQALPPSRPERKGVAEVAWAVWLGCTTARRLAGEWGVSSLRAAQLLADAAAAGRIVRLRRGRYSAGAPRGVAVEVRPLPRLTSYAAADRRSTPAA